MGALSLDVEPLETFSGSTLLAVNPSPSAALERVAGDSVLNSVASDSSDRELAVASVTGATTSVVEALSALSEFEAVDAVSSSRPVKLSALEITGDAVCVVASKLFSSPVLIALVELLTVVGGASGAVATVSPEDVLDTGCIGCAPVGGMRVVSRIEGLGDASRLGSAFEQRLHLSAGRQVALPSVQGAAMHFQLFWSPGTLKAQSSSMRQEVPSLST